MTIKTQSIGVTWQNFCVSCGVVFECCTTNTEIKRVKICCDDGVDVDRNLYINPYCVNCCQKHEVNVL